MFQTFSIEVVSTVSNVPVLCSSTDQVPEKLSTLVLAIGWFCTTVKIVLNAKIPYRWTTEYLSIINKMLPGIQNCMNQDWLRFHPYLEGTITTIALERTHECRTVHGRPVEYATVI